MNTIHHLWSGLSRILLTLLAFVAAPFWVSAVDLDPVLVFQREPDYGRGITERVKVSGHYAWVLTDCDEYLVLWFFDITNPASPVRVATYGSLNAPLALTVSGNYAYISDENGIDIVDFSNLENPHSVARYAQAASETWSLAVSGNFLYLADDSRGLEIVDISNPANPERVAVYPNTITAHASRFVTVSGHYAYYLENGVLQVLDITDPRNPQLLGQCVAGEHVHNITVSGAFVYIMDPINGLYIVDVSNPASPSLVNILDCSPHDIAVSGNYVYAGNLSGLAIYDVSNPTAPQKLGSSPYGAYGVAVVKNYVYVADGYAGLKVLAVKPAKLQRLGSCDTPGTASGLATSGNFAYVADGTNGLVIIDTADSAHPQPVGGYQTGGFARTVTLSGKSAYVADDTNGFFIINVSNPANPQRIGGCSLPGRETYQIALVGNYAFLANAEGGLQIIDVSVPANPTPAGHFSYTNGYVTGVAFGGNYVYMTDFYHGLRILDVSDPTNPSVLDWHDDAGGYGGGCTNGAPLGLFLADHQICVSYGATFALYDVTNAANPSYRGVFYFDIGSSSRQGFGCALAISSNFVYMAGPDGALHVIDTSYRFSFRAGGNRSLTSVSGISISGGKVYVADGTNGLVVLNAFSYSPPSLEGRSLLTVSYTTNAYSIDYDSQVYYFLNSNTVTLGDLNQGSYSYQATGASNSELWVSFPTSGAARHFRLTFTNLDMGLFKEEGFSIWGDFRFADGIPGPLEPRFPQNGVNILPSRPVFSWGSRDPIWPVWCHIYVERNGQKYWDEWTQAFPCLPATALPPGNYTWSVQGWNPFGSGPWSESYSFTVRDSVPSIPTQLSPHGVTATNLTVVYSWKRDTNATWYELCAVKNSRIVFDQWYPNAQSTGAAFGAYQGETGTDAFSVEVSGHSAGDYRWWVRSWSPNGMGQWSTNASFTVPNTKPNTVTMAYPSGAIGTDPMVQYRWTPDPWATWYEICVVKDAKIIIDVWCDAKESVVGNNIGLYTLKMSSYGPGNYTWWMRAWNPNGMGPWGNGISFTIPAQYW